MSEQSPNPVEILRRREVEARTGLSRSTIYQRIRERTFPLPISLGAKSVGWIKSEIDGWLAERIKQSRTSCGGCDLRNVCRRGNMEKKL